MRSIPDSSRSAATVCDNAALFGAVPEPGEHECHLRASSTPSTPRSAVSTAPGTLATAATPSSRCATPSPGGTAAPPADQNRACPPRSRASAKPSTDQLRSARRRARGTCVPSDRAREVTDEPAQPFADVAGARCVRTAVCVCIVRSVCYLSIDKTTWNASDDRGPACLARSTRRLQTLAASAPPADDGVQADVAPLTPVGILVHAPDVYGCFGPESAKTGFRICR